MSGSIKATRQTVSAVGPRAGKARATRQSVCAVGARAGKARVTRQYICVLSPLAVPTDLVLNLELLEI